MPRIVNSRVNTLFCEIDFSNVVSAAVVSFSLEIGTTSWKPQSRNAVAGRPLAYGGLAIPTRSAAVIPTPETAAQRNPSSYQRSAAHRQLRLLRGGPDARYEYRCLSPRKSGYIPSPSLRGTRGTRCRIPVVFLSARSESRLTCEGEINPSQTPAHHYIWGKGNTPGCERWGMPD